MEEGILEAIYELGEGGGEAISFATVTMKLQLKHWFIYQNVLGAKVQLKFSIT